MLFSVQKMLDDCEQFIQCAITVKFNNPCKKHFLIKPLANYVFCITLHFPCKTTLVTFPTASPRTSPNELISSSHSGYFHCSLTLVAGHPGLVNMQETGQLFGEPCSMLLACIIDNRWEKHESSSMSQWNESHKVITIPFNAILSKSTCHQFVMCHLQPPGVRPLSLCQKGSCSETLLRRRRK